MKKFINFFYFGLFTLLLLSHQIQAQDAKITFKVGDTLFHNIKGTHTTSNYIEFYDSEDIATQIAIFQFNTERSYYLLDGFSLVGNLYVMYPHGFRFADSDEFEVRRTFGMGAAVFLRFEFIRLYGQNLFGEMGGGILGTTKKFPPQGTHFNFSKRIGFGTNIPLNDKLVLVFGVRYMHISNGKGFVRENPQYNGNGVYMGIKFEW